MIIGRDIERVFFVGIGGIGMSALARYFLAGGYDVEGYDRTSGDMTDALGAEGCRVVFVDSPDELSEPFRTLSMKSKVVVVYTPAIPASSKILSFFRNSGYTLYKRSEILGVISKETDTLAVAGTHGKTTVSTILAHILKLSHVDCSAFLGGISKNYETNLLLGESRYTVMEADEYDRSFLHLRPLMAVITSVDPDHLDIYVDHESMIEAYIEFCRQIRPGGAMVVNKKIESLIPRQPDVSYSTYGLGDTADWCAINIIKEDSFYRFDLKTPSVIYRDLYFSYPGLINVENAVAACALALKNGVMPEEIRKALVCFKGVKRRFDIRVNQPDIVYIDDYAHHPEEIKAFIDSIREQYSGKRITGIFQPHLYSRTRDHAHSFATALDLLDTVILMPVYPAREEPIPGVESDIILKKMTLPGVKVLPAEEVVMAIDFDKTDVLVTIGAGDIDRLAVPVEERIRTVFKR